MSGASDARQTQLAVAQVLQRKVESSLQRSVLHKWRSFVKDRQFEVHLKRCATSMKHSTRRRMYSSYFLRWLAVAQRSASTEAREAYRVPQEVPLTTKRSILAFTRRYFHKWKRHNRERRQRLVANVEAIRHVNDERSRYRALLRWQTHALRKRMQTSAATVPLGESEARLFDVVLRAVDVLGGHSGVVDALQPSSDETAEQATTRRELASDTLSGLCEDLVVVLVLANEWSKDGQGEKVSELLERLWRENAQAKAACEEKEETLGELRSVMEEVLACLDRRQRTDEDPAVAGQRRKDAERAAQYAFDNGDEVPLKLLKASDNALGAIQATEQGLVHQAGTVETLQEAVEHALAALSGAGAAPVPKTDLAHALTESADEVRQEVRKAGTTDETGVPQCLRDMLQQLAEAKKNNDALAKQLEEAQAALADTQRALEGDRDANQQQLAEAKKNNDALAKQLEEAQAALADTQRALEGDRDANQQQLAEANNQIAQLAAQLEEQRTTADKAKDALRAALEETAQLSETVQHQNAAITDLENSNHNAAKRLDQLADQFEAKSHEYRDKEAQQAVEVQELQSAVERALVALQGKEHSDALVQAALSSGRDPANDAARSRALVDALDVAWNSVGSLRSGEPVTEFVNRTDAEKTSLSQELQASRDAFKKLDHIVAVANEFLQHPRLSDVSFEGADAVAAAEALAADGAPAAKALMAAVQKAADEACTCLETLPKKSQDTLDSTDGESVMTVLKLCGDALYQSAGELTTSMEATASNEALSVFLRDIVRDAIGRVAALANGFCATLGGETSPSAWQSLQLTEHPMALSVDRDPSDYVEYILRNVNLSDEGKRAVQNHLRSEAILGPTAGHAPVNEHAAREREALGGTLDPSTSQERRADSASAGEFSPLTTLSPPPCTWDVVAEFHDLLAMLTDLSVQYDERFAQQNKHISAADDALKHMSGSLGLPDTTAPEELSRAVQDAVRACRTWRMFADDCMEALGKHTEERGSSSIADAVDPAAAEEAGAKLLAECSGASDRVRALLQDLGLSSTPSTPDGLGVERDLKAVQSHIAQLQSLRNESDAFIQGLNHAFDDETLSNSMSSTLSSRGRSLRSKKKPLPAALVRSGEVFSLKRGSQPVQKPMSAMTPEERLRSLRASARDRLEEIQELRRACRATLFILEGTYAPAKKVPAYGQALVPRLLQQLEDIKKALPCTDPHMMESVAASSDGSNAPASVAIGTRLTTLTNMVNSLQLTQAGLEESLAAKARQGAMALEDVQNENTQLKASCEHAKQQLQVSKDAASAAGQRVKELESLLETQQAATARSDAQAGEASQALKEAASTNAVLEAQLEAERCENEALAKRAAVLQHEANVLVGALGEALVSLAEWPTATDDARCSHTGLPLAKSSIADPAERTPSAQAETEQDLQRLLKVDAGEGVVTLVESAVAQHRQRLRELGTNYKSQISALRADLEQLKAYVMDGFVHDLQPLCAAVLSASEDAVQLLSVENDMLRPRALESETLAAEMHALAQAVHDKEGELAATQAALTLADNQNAQLRRALQDAQMALVLSGEGSASDGLPSTDPTHRTVVGKDGKDGMTHYLRSSEYAALLADLEAKMIRGATAMTVEAIDAISGQDMAKAFGAVAADTCELYESVQGHVRAVLDAFSMYPPTNAFNQRCLEEAVDGELRSLREHADRAKRLWSRLPPFFVAPYARVA